MGQSDESEAAKTGAVRPLRAADVAALADLWVASWQEAMPAIDFSARRDWIAGFLGVPAHATLVAEQDGAPAGFATLEGGYLHQLVVASWAKGGGLARRLLDAAKARWRRSSPSPPPWAFPSKIWPRCQPTCRSGRCSASAHLRGHGRRDGDSAAVFGKPYPLVLPMARK